MQKYIGLSLYLVGLILLSYTFFYFSPKKQQFFSLLANNNTNVEKLQVSTGNVNNKKQQEFFSTGYDSGLNNKVSNNLTGDTDNKITYTGDLIIKPNNKENYDFSGNKINTEETEADFENNFSGVSLKKIKISPYDDVFQLLGYPSGFVYQVSGKDIYLKKIKSVDYEQEKNNINQLIQQIGGNIKSLNLYGNKQAFINIDVYYGKVVIMLVNYKNNNYLVIMPYEVYKNNKSYLKNILFAK